MRTLPYFLWKGRDSRDMGLVVTALPAPQRPRERLRLVTVPGRPGALALPEGGAVYDPVTLRCRCAVMSPGALREALAWLRGTGGVMFSSEPGRVRQAVIPGPVCPEPLPSPGCWSMAVDFLVQPFCGKYPPETNITVTSSGRSIYNPGDVPSMPKVTVNGSGAVSLTIGGTAVGLSLTTGTIVLDWESGVVTNAAGTQSLAAFVTGGPQRIPVGSSAVSWRSVNNGSVSSVVIEPRWRWF